MVCDETFVPENVTVAERLLVALLALSVIVTDREPLPLVGVTVHHD